VLGESDAGSGLLDTRLTASASGQNPCSGTPASVASRCVTQTQPTFVVKARAALVWLDRPARLVAWIESEAVRRLAVRVAEHDDLCGRDPVDPGASLGTAAGVAELDELLAADFEPPVLAVLGKPRVSERL
jgi:hypothetical protein